MMRFLGRLIHRVLQLVRLLFVIVIGYGIVMIVFREAYGIALPNPMHWLSKHWPSGFHLDL